MGKWMEVEQLSRELWADDASSCGRDLHGRLVRVESVTSRNTYTLVGEVALIAQVNNEPCHFLLHGCPEEMAIVKGKPSDWTLTQIFAPVQ